MPLGAETALAVDTSLAIPLLLRSHPFHRAAVDWRGGRRLYLSGHAGIETYSVLTRLPGEEQVRPGDALAVIESNFEGMIWPRPAAVGRALANLAAAEVSGGAAYDAWIALAAAVNGAVLASRDRRAEATYRRVGATVELVA